MPVVLREHQHELANVDGTGGVVFGTEDTGYLTLVYPAIAAGTQTNNDQQRPQEDGTAFGRDFRGSKTITYEIGVLTDALNQLDGGDAHRANLDYLNALEALWLDEKWRQDPRNLAMLRSCSAGRTFRCYGRPRRYDETAGVTTQLGYTPIVADFMLIDDRWYADVESSVDVNLVPAPDGGLVAPLVAPLTTTLATSSTNTVTIGGNRSTWPVVEFHGPVASPSLQIGDSISIGLSRTLAVGEVITVDTRPWQRSVLRASDGAGFAGSLSRATPVMRKCLIAPGSYGLTYRGTDATGNSYARLRWRDARARP